MLWRLAILAVWLLALPANAGPPVVYFSPGDDGVNPGGSPEVPSLEPATIHLYIDGGSMASPADPCFQGTGDEVCAWNLTLAGQSGLSLSSFTPAGSVVSNLSGNVLRCSRLDPAAGALGPVKIGDLVVNGSQGGTLELTAGESIDASLGTLVIAPGTLVALPEPGADMLGAAGLVTLLLLSRRRARRRARA